MKIIFLILSFLFVAQNSFANTAEKCLKQEDVDNVLMSFNLQARSEEDASLSSIKTIDLCNEENLSNKVIRGILYLSQVNHGDKTGSSAVLADGVFNYLKKRIQNIVMEYPGFTSCKIEGVAAFVQRGEGPIMHICPDAIKYFPTDLTFSSVLIHEARHIDGYSHVHCKQGSLLNQDLQVSGACDSDFETQGSYGVAVSYYLDIYESTNDLVEKQAARSAAVTDFFDRFNRLPLGIKSGMISQNQNEEMAFFDGVQKVTFLKVEGTNVMGQRNILPTFFSDNGSVKSYNYISNSDSLLETGGLFANLYRTTFSAADHTSLVDVYYDHTYDDKAYNCFLFQSKLHCGSGDDPDVEIALNSIKPLRIIYKEKTKQLFISAQNGFLYLLPASWRELQKSTEKDFKKSSAPEFLLSYVLLDTTPFKVDLTGKLYKQSQNKQWTLVPQYKNEVIKKIMAPFYWSKKIEDL